MSDFSLTLVLQIKTSKIINDMAKVQQTSEIISAFGGIFFDLDIFDLILSSVIDSHLGLRSRLIGYQYSEISKFSTLKMYNNFTEPETFVSGNYSVPEHGCLGEAENFSPKQYTCR